MAGKRTPPDGRATQFRTGDEQAKIARKGGIASGKKRREKKTIQRILSDYLEEDAKKNKVLAKLADAAGLDDDASVKEVIVLKLLMNSLKEGDLSDLERLMKLLGEQKETSGAEEKLDALLKEMDDAVKRETT